MKYLMLLVLASCVATTQDVRQANASDEEALSCPSPMSNEQRMSGTVRCRAMCASYGRGFEVFDNACRCVCAPEARSGFSASLM